MRNQTGRIPTELSRKMCFKQAVDEIKKKRIAAKKSNKKYCDTYEESGGFFSIGTC
jgi:hypothetical protein